jgi:lipopolysaccharide transport system ATP-binding protein
MQYSIRIENLSKQYSIGVSRGRGVRTFREAMVDATSAPWKRLRSRWARMNDDASGAGSSENTIWALKDVCLQVEAGDVVGIIGRNGSGKSTLLKILSRVTRPTSGRAKLHGRVGSLLEVGTGFHSELTGRENIYLNGAILGMTRKDIARKFDEIVEFAGISQFLDTPCKHYSSGMYVRLAFAVAAHLETEILFIDEVLAVGDVVFQRKCLSKIGNLIRCGRTVLFVSHNMATVQNLCKNALFLANGRVVSSGDCASVLADYMATTRTASDGATNLASYREPGKLNVFRKIVTLDEEGFPIGHFLSGSALNVEIEYHSPVPLRSPSVTMIFEAMTGERLFSIQTLAQHGYIQHLPQRGTLRCHVPVLPLIQGIYYMTFLFGSQGNQIDYLERPISITVDPADFFKTGNVPPEHQGRFLVEARWQLPDSELASTVYTGSCQEGQTDHRAEEV